MLLQSDEFKINWITLSFLNKFEQPFQDHYFKKSLNHIRVSLIIGVSFYALFSVLDAILMPDVKYELWFIRYGIVIPYFLAIFAFTFSRHFKKYMQISVAFGVLIAGIGIIAMILIAPYPANSSYYAGLILVFIYGYSFVKLRFIWATITGWTIVLAYEIVSIWFIQTPFAMLLNNNFFFLSSNLFGMFIGYSIEYYSRSEFLNAYLLEKEKKNVDKANLELEDRVKERTADLLQANEKLEMEISEKELAENSLKSKVEFERLITRLSQKFIRLDLLNIDKGINNILKNITKHIEADNGLVKIFNSDNKSFKLNYNWSDLKSSNNINNSDTFFQTMPWVVTRIKKHKTINIRLLSKLPLDALKDKKTLNSSGIQSAIYMPLVYAKSVIGLIGFESLRNTHIGTEQVHSLLKIVAGMFVNALERKKAYDLLIKSEQKYRTLFEESQDAVFISTPEGELLEINTAGVELFGYDSKEELLKVNIARDLYLSGEDRDKYKEEITQKGQVRNYESVFKKKNGEKVIINETTTVVKDDKNNAVAYHGIMRNVTEHAKLQQQLLQSQKMESIGMLAGGIAHDFNNILTAINGYAEILSLKMKDTDPLIKDVRGILNGGQRAINLTRQLLTFSRKQYILPKVIDIDLIISELDKMLRRLIGEDIDLVTTLFPNTKRIKADPSQIEQILINLAVNARDAINQRTTRAAEKKITIETNELYVGENYITNHPGFKEGHYTVISISDTGIGMNDDTKEKIFEPFYTTKKVGKGTGLGLSTVYGIVKQNNGFIYVYSEPEKGTTFKIYWPQAEQEMPSDLMADADLIRKIQSGHETILFVEDDFEVRKYTTKALNSIGYNIIEAENGKRALEILGKDNLNIKLLITDIVMPEMGGKELADIINKIQPSMKILFTSGYTDNHLVHNGTLAEDINYLQKPYSLQTIAYEIRNILDN